jgi:GxxExxY protein
LVHEVRKAGLGVVQQYSPTVIYDGAVVGQYVVDLLVEQALLVELKSVKALHEAHRRNASTISRRAGYGYVCCSTLEPRGWRSNAWPMACNPSSA